MRARWLLVGCLVALSGCSLLPLDRAEAPPVVAPELPPRPTAPPEPTHDPSPAPPPSPPVVVQPVPEAPPPEPMHIAVLLSSRTPAYERIANALSEEMGEIDIYDLADRSLTAKEKVDLIRSTGAEVVVAIGIRAAEFAKTIDGIPVILSQVFNLSGIDVSETGMRGVAVLPPLDLQLNAWLALNPNLTSVGAILGSGHDSLIDEAHAAAQQQGVRFQHRIAQSDRETLYLFTRLVPDIDGFWLFPDNRVLSAPILRQMLTYASRHQVQVAVFNDALLPLGATISATSVDEDVAETIVALALRLLEGDASTVPAVTPLNEIQIKTNNEGRESFASDGLAIREDVH